MSNKFINLVKEAQPTSESIQVAKEESTVETRLCGSCKNPVSIGERVSVLTKNGEEWRHPQHT